MPIAWRTASRRRSRVSFFDARLTPAPASVTRRATSGWSRPNGTTASGTPAATDFCTMPIPPWQTTAAARSSTWRCATKRSTRAFGAVGRSAPYASAIVTTTRTGSSRRPSIAAREVLVALVLRRARDEHPRVAVLEQPVRRLGGRLPDLRADVAEHGGQARARVLERLAGQHEQAVRPDHVLDRVAERRQPRSGAQAVDARHHRLGVDAHHEPVHRAVADPPERPGVGWMDAHGRPVASAATTAP
jgi:hypothetical protein